MDESLGRPSKPVSKPDRAWREMLDARRADDAAAARQALVGVPSLAALAPLVGTGEPLIIAQLGQSLDGRIAAPNGESRYINGPEGLAHLHRLRALVDAVIVGAETVAIDNPSLTVRRVSGPNPVRVVIDPKARLAPDRTLFTDGISPVLHLIGEDRSNTSPASLSLPVDKDGRFAPADIVAALKERGLTRLLVEGGANTIGGFLQAGLIDRLHLLVGPVILGAGRSGLDLPGIERLDQALRPVVTCYPLGADTLFDCVFSE